MKRPLEEDVEILNDYIDILEAIIEDAKNEYPTVKKGDYCACCGCDEFNNDDE